MKMAPLGSLTATTALLSGLSVVAATFTAEDMLSAPRPQAAIASPDGKHAISVVDQWHPKDDK
jgi:hypothetical protein